MEREKERKIERQREGERDTEREIYVCKYIEKARKKRERVGNFRVFGIFSFSRTQFVDSWGH